MTTEETAELAVTAEALTAWERILGQLHGTLEVGPTRDWMETQIKAARRAGLKTQVQLIAPVVTRPHVVRTATGYREDPLAVEANEQWTEAESRAAWGDR